MMKVSELLPPNYKAWDGVSWAIFYLEHFTVSVTQALIYSLWLNLAAVRKTRRLCRRNKLKILADPITRMPVV